MNVITKNAIIQCFTRLLETHSLQTVTVKMICDQLQISRPCFYYHFKDKYELMEYSVLKMLLPLYINDTPDLLKRLCDVHRTINLKATKNLICSQGIDSIYTYSTRFHSRLLEFLFPEDFSEEEKEAYRFMNTAFNFAVMGLEWSLIQQNKGFPFLFAATVVSVMPQKLDLFYKSNSFKVVSFFETYYPELLRMVDRPDPDLESSASEL